MNKRLLSLLSAGMLLSMSSCAWLQGQAQPTPDIQSLDYHLRWSHAEFAQRYAWLNFLMPPAHAELPPQYQNAFSLMLRFDHQAQSLEAVYHEQMVIDNQTHRSFTRRYGAAKYTEIMTLIQAPKFICQSSVRPGMVGPAPELLTLDYADKSVWVYPSGDSGYDGPGDSEGVRRHLCTDTLEKSLQAMIAEGLNDA